MSGRRRSLDWLRGVGVLIMIESHVIDSWTSPADRGETAYRWAALIGGFGAPIFLFLAGVALALAAGARVKRGMTDAEAARLARRRGWQVLGLAILFRLQSFVLGGGPWMSLIKVDILNVMGIAMLAAAMLWGSARRLRWRAVLLAAAAVTVAMATPVVRATPLLDAMPDPLEWYFRAPSASGMFTLFPWAGFVFAGAAVGLFLDAASTVQADRRVHLSLAIAGAAMAAGAYAASYLPAIYPDVSFWTSSPAFFFIRLGILVLAVPLASALRQAWQGGAWVEVLGVSSLFVYWVHVEVVYGLVSLPLHRALTLPQALAGVALVTALMVWLVVAKERLLKGGRPNTKNRQNGRASTTLSAFSLASL